ncbi:MAG: MFS transporter [Thermodesulfobacterium geofontis]|uniref:MFS transporter n=1 Tax=Thermodesulfobacterium geofontis TaxID=1295609 RepID=A0A2N7PQD5_9BACT|nr:MAG: MFS transporter [Thermodesulfobacterium geofontis]
MPHKSPFLLVILLGLVSLFADITYEGARSIIGPYLATLGASATVVGFISGLGEFLGYGLRLIFGYLADKIRKYWAVTFIGYFISLISVPALALTKTWIQAVILVLLERIGKAIRTPARDTILSYATFKIGRGKGFGFHEAIDQIGAITGPLIVAVILCYTKNYKLAFAVLLIPVILTLSILFISIFYYPSPQKFENEKFLIKNTNFSKDFWIYAFAIGIYGAGYADFALIAYHFKKTELLTNSLIPIFYAIAMGIDAVSALVFGYFFDKKGFIILIFSVIISSLFAPLVFLGSLPIALFGVILWGIGLGAQESILRATVALFVPKEKRATGYGIFNTFYGFLWFLGSTLLGILYDFSIHTLIIISILLQLLSLPLLIKLSKFRL